MSHHSAGHHGEVARAAVRSIEEWQRIMGRRPIGFRHSLGAGASAFRARHESVSVGGSTLTRMDATAHRVQRVREPESPGAFLQVGLQISGRSCTRIGNRNVDAGPGDILLFNTDHEFSVAFADNLRCVLFLVPCETLSVAREAEELTVARIRGEQGVGTVLARMLRTLGEDLGVLTGRGADYVFSGAVSLVDGIVMEAHEAVAEPTPALVDEVSAVIEAHLGDPALSPQLVADSLYMSLRSLQQHLARLDRTVSQMIRNSRLDRARLMLGDPADQREIRVIAEECGFVSPAHFSREFARKFEAAPREYRLSYR